VFILFFVSVAQHITAWIFYYRDVAAVAVDADKAEQKTYYQIKKELKKKVIGRAKEFKQSDRAWRGERCLRAKREFILRVSCLQLPRNSQAYTRPKTKFKASQTD
jgi:hypothetical protein